MDARLHRRTFLRGVGTTLALPLLDAMLPVASLAAAPEKKTPPVRMAFLFIPNGANMATWRPAAAGANFELPYALEPLKDVKEYVTVLSGLAQHNAFALGDGGGDHARSTACFLTGCHPRKTSGADITVGVSVDQYAALQLGKYTRFPSLEIGCERGAQSGACDTGYSCAYSSNVSWRDEHTPVAKEVDPRLVFERLFGNGDPKETEESRALRDRYRKSILDFVMDDAKSLQSHLGVRDRQKLDEYFTSVRELEQRMARSDNEAPVVVNGMTRPSGVPSEYGEHLKLMSDMLVLAFQADLTRVSTFMFANDGSNRPYRNINIPEGHHDLSHHGGDAQKIEKLKEINRFHVTNLAYLLNRLKSVKEGNGTLLDNCIIVYGAGISDGDRHNHDDLPVLLAGRGGGTIKSGRHVQYENPTPMTNLFLSMLDRMKVECHSLGDSTGRLKDLG